MDFFNYNIENPSNVFKTNEKIEKDFEYVSKTIDEKCGKFVDIDTLEKMKTEFYKKYTVGKNEWHHFCIDGVGIEDIMNFPETDTHRENFPNLYNFNFHHFNCDIYRGYGYTWLGYVKTNKSHPIWLNSEAESDINVHGGLTYTCKEDNTLGFDTNHYNDAEPFSLFNATKKYRDRDYTILNLKSICLQLFVKLPKWSPKTHKEFPLSLQKYFWEIYKLWYLRKNSILSKLVAKEIWISIIAFAFEFEKNSKNEELIENYAEILKMKNFVDKN